MGKSAALPRASAPTWWCWMKTWTSPLCTTKQKKEEGLPPSAVALPFAVLLVLLVDLAAVHASHQGHKALGLLEQAEDFRAQLHLEASLLAGLQLHPGKAGPGGS